MNIGMGGYYLGNSGIGLGVYTGQLISSLSRVDRANRYIIFTPDGKEFASDSLADNFELRRHRAVPIGNQWARRAVWEQSLSLKVRKNDLDVFHIPYYSFHPIPARKTVVTVHDMAPCRYPVYKGRHIGRIYLDRIEQAVKKADFIITDSEFSRREIGDVLGISGQKTSVIPLAVPSAFTPVTGKNELNRVRESYGLPDRYILYIGGFDIRKNVGSLLRAFASLKKDKKIDRKLVLGGTIPIHPKLLRRGAFIDVLRLILELEIGPDVCLAGYIDETDLPAVYSSADLFVFPSLYEGFGLPVLEAMSCGAPVVVSDRSSLPEIVNRKDLLFDPEDIESLKEKMLLLLSDETIRTGASEWGLKRAGDFSWEKAARETCLIYERMDRS